jgi:hypothetical protein
MFSDVIGFNSLEIRPASGTECQLIAQNYIILYSSAREGIVNSVISCQVKYKRRNILTA